MTQKTISLPENIYNSLKKRKKSKETFSDLISRLIKENDQKSSQPDISCFYGKLEEAEKGEWDEIEKKIYENRKASKTHRTDSWDD
ncbi:MAG: antitoxin VapB family protein [Candidatus Lokiarchaeota archaeon]|nr:antitoxin VapB family protein [Candidatus Harpocratesius repetitus]